MSKLPEFLKGYFWDTKFGELDRAKDEFLVIKRVLDRGDTKAVQWVLSTYGISAVKAVVVSSRDLSRQTARLWTTILELSEGEVPCLNKPYSPTPFGLSS